MSNVFLQVAEKLKANQIMFMHEKVPKKKALISSVAHHIYILMDTYTEWLSKLLIPGQPL